MKTPGTTQQHDQFTALYAENAVKVRRVISAMLDREDLHLVDDFAQDVWLTVWRNLINGSPMTSPNGLVVTIARRRVFAHFRLAHVRREVPTDTTSHRMDVASYTAGLVAA
jgi:DNA-directed RNA polymerase specialized sigma24 family protein